MDDEPSTIAGLRAPLLDEEDGDFAAAAPPPRRRRRVLVPLAACLAACAAALVLVPLVLAPRPAVGDPPRCRKGAAAAPLNGSLVVFSGMASGGAVLKDAAAFDLAERRWAPLRAARAAARAAARPAEPPRRWKAAATALTLPGPDKHAAAEEALFLHGGDPADGSEYLADAWTLTGGGWRRLEAAAAAPSPGARRAHAAIAAAPGRLVLFGGRRGRGELLGDAWLGAVAGGNVSWTLLGAGDEEENKGKPPAPRPEPRKGHALALLPAAAGGNAAPRVLLHGGRNASAYMGHALWALDVGSGTWEELAPAPGSLVPPPRDHHALAVHGGRVVLFGGRGAADGARADAVALRDLWTFDLATRRWAEAPSARGGLRPAARFLFGAAPAAGPRPALVVFGGEGAARCKLNDVWALDLATLRWEELAPPALNSRRCARAFGGRGRGPAAAAA